WREPGSPTRAPERAWREPGSPRVQMKLGSKIFLMCAAVIVVLGGVSALSLRAIGRLVTVNREVATQAVPALGVSAAVRDGLIARMDAGIEAWAAARQATVLAAQAEAARLEERTWGWVLTALGTAIVLGLAGAAWIANRLTRSLRTLSVATQHVGAGAFNEPL